MTDLGTLGGDRSFASNINESGQIVGDSETADGKTRGFLWQNGTMTDLGTLGGYFSSARDINESGQIVGDSDGQAFLWQNGAMTDLLPVRGFSSSVININDAGQVLGSYERYFTNDPFLWENGKAVDLRNLIAPNSGWDDLYAIKLNNKGQIIGNGIFQGQTRAFIMNPTDQIIDPEPIPEPSTIIGSILGIGTLVNTARRRKGKQQS
jgi:probable HAF family extracellular repeat protein